MQPFMHPFLPHGGCTAGHSDIANTNAVTTTVPGRFAALSPLCHSHACNCHMLADTTGTSKVDAHVACCVAGSSYAKGAAANSPTCFQHVKPGTTAAQCSKAINASGYLNQGPGSPTLFLAHNASGCSDSIGVGNVAVSCPGGCTWKKLHFVIQSLAST